MLFVDYFHVTEVLLTTSCSCQAIISANINTNNTSQLNHEPMQRAANTIDTTTAAIATIITVAI